MLQADVTIDDIALAIGALTLCAIVLGILIYLIIFEYLNP